MVSQTVQVIKLRDDIAKLDEEATRIATEQAAESRAVKVRSSRAYKYCSADCS
jgi:hypothetical protein